MAKQCKCAKETPLILVFYTDRETMKNSSIMTQYVESVNRVIEIKQMNAVAFFIPTDGEEFIDCINPAIITEEEMANVNILIDDINKHFGIGDKLDIPENDETN